MPRLASFAAARKESTSRFRSSARRTDEPKSNSTRGTRSSTRRSRAVSRKPTSDAWVGDEVAECGRRSPRVRSSFSLTGVLILRGPQGLAEDFRNERDGGNDADRKQRPAEGSPLWRCEVIAEQQRDASPQCCARPRNCCDFWNGQCNFLHRRLPFCTWRYWKAERAVAFYQQPTATSRSEKWTGRRSSSAETTSLQARSCSESHPRHYDRSTRGSVRRASAVPRTRPWARSCRSSARAAVRTSGCRSRSPSRC